MGHCQILFDVLGVAVACRTARMEPLQGLVHAGILLPVRACMQTCRDHFCVCSQAFHERIEGQCAQPHSLEILAASSDRRMLQCGLQVGTTVVWPVVPACNVYLQNWCSLMSSCHTARWQNQWCNSVGCNCLRHTVRARLEPYQIGSKPLQLAAFQPGHHAKLDFLRSWLSYRCSVVCKAAQDPTCCLHRVCCCGNACSFDALRLHPDLRHRHLGGERVLCTYRLSRLCA
mmetsp:Transcript_93996/g.166405  ORF Transcript_93996/g.166405 Transcript_93996/m.166405 type:complete len:230 (+) Transcript_93996:400-1089(+)